MPEKYFAISEKVRIFAISNFVIMSTLYSIGHGSKSFEEFEEELRSRIQQQMEERHLDKVVTGKYSVNYTPAKTIMQFNGKAFKQENKELYASYCIPKQKEAAIVIRRTKNPKT